MEQEIREIIRRELPRLLTEDPEFYNWVWTIVHEHSFSRAETESRFNKVLAEIRQSREESMRRWEESNERWKQQWEEDRRRWEENQRQIRALFEGLQRLDRRIGAHAGVSKCTPAQTMLGLLDDGKMSLLQILW